MANFKTRANPPPYQKLQICIIKEYL